MNNWIMNFKIDSAFMWIGIAVFLMMKFLGADNLLLVLIMWVAIVVFDSGHVFLTYLWLAKEHKRKSL